MNKLEIKTNHNWRNFFYANEVPEKVLKDFDWLDDDTIDGFINYRGNYYHIQEFMRVPPNSDLFSGWHGYLGDSYFSGILIKLSDDGEQYQIATYMS